MKSRIIAHLDMDAFFASVEERDRPWLKGLPIVVGADPSGGEGRGVVSTANYAAREYGIKSALPIRVAWEYSERARKEGKPGVAFITPLFSKYSEASNIVMDILNEYSGTVMQTSVDEAYFDLTYCGSFKRAGECARVIKQKIRKKINLTSSIGLAPNRMVAKIASDFQKPDGLTIVTPQKVESFLGGLPVRAIPGVGPKTELTLKQNGVGTVQEVRALSWQDLDKLFGSLGFSLYQKVRGISDSTLQAEEVEAKSIGEHDTFMEDTDKLKVVLFKIASMSIHIIERMQKADFSEFRTIVLTVRFEDFETKTRSLTTKDFISHSDDLERRAVKLALPFFEHSENPQKKRIRMIGLRIEKLR